MAEHERGLPGQELEPALRDLGRRIVYPDGASTASPDLAARLRTRLESGAPPPRRFAPRPSRRLTAILLAAALILLALAILAPGARATLSHWLGLPGVVFINQPAVPTRTPVPVATALDLGEHITLDVARRIEPFAILLPRRLGSPDEVYARSGSPQQVTLVYRARPGLPRAGGTGVGVLLTEFAGSLDPERAFYFKGLGPGTTLTRVSVNGNPGYWLAGRPHAFFYADARGAIQYETIRLAGNTLLWQQGSLTLRLESALDEQAALRIAASVR